MKLSEKKFYLGVEGGATKSTAILVSEHDILIAKKLGRSLSYHSASRQEVKKNLENLISPLLKRAKKGKLYGVFGLAAFDTKRDEMFYKELVRSFMPKRSVFLVLNDAYTAIEAKCPNEENRILVISGTGSSVYGESGNKRAKSVGWDFILGDEGSGYDIGLKIMRTAMRSWDGRIKKTILEQLVLDKSHSKTMEVFMEKVYRMFHTQSDRIKQYVASFAVLMDKAIEEYDWAALQIQQEVIQDLVQGVQAVVAKLGMQEKGFCLGITGSVWKMPGLKEKFTKEITKQFPLTKFSTREEGGEWGAVYLAKKLSNP